MQSLLKWRIYVFFECYFASSYQNLSGIKGIYIGKYKELKIGFGIRNFSKIKHSIHRNHLEFGLLSLFYIHIFLLAALLSCIYINGTEMRALNKTTVFSNLHFTRFHFRTKTRAGGTGQGGNFPITPHSLQPN